MGVRWLDEHEVGEIFERVCVAEGCTGQIRDERQLRLALNRPRNLAASGGRSLSEIAAAYAWAFTRYNVFSDCQPQASRAITATFLGLNGASDELPSEEAAELWDSIHQGRVDEQVVAEWIRNRVEPKSRGRA